MVGGACGGGQGLDVEISIMRLVLIYNDARATPAVLA